MDLQIPIQAGQQMEKEKNVCTLLFNKMMLYQDFIKTKIQSYILELYFTHDVFFGTQLYMF